VQENYYCQSSLKLAFNYKAFSTKLNAHKMFGSREFRTMF